MPNTVKLLNRRNQVKILKCFREKENKSHTTDTRGQGSSVFKISRITLSIFNSICSKIIKQISAYIKGIFPCKTSKEIQLLCTFLRKLLDYVFYQNNAVNYETKGYRIQERVGPGKENNEGKPLNDGCVQGLRYNPFRQESDAVRVLETVVHTGEKDGEAEWL